MPTAKQLWLLTGGNGAGKSTFYRLYLAPQGLPFVNADLIAKHIHTNNPEKVSYQAAVLAEKLRGDLLASGSSFCFETVFSHPSKIDFVAAAKAHHYDIILVYIHLLNAELNQARVIQRVSEGGHDVPPNKIISRIPRTMQNVSKAIYLANQTYLLDNSFRDNPYRQVASVKHGSVALSEDPLPEWAQTILAGYLAH